MLYKILRPLKGYKNNVVFYLEQELNITCCASNFVRVE